MAKVTAPLMSLDASGSVAGTITFSKWKGRSYVRELVTPSNPRTAGQTGVRVILGALAKAASQVLTSTKDPGHVGSQFFTDARDNAPSGQSWISQMQRIGYSTDTAMQAAWGLLSGTKKGYFDTAAAAAGFVNYVPSYVDNSTYTAGLQLYALCYYASNSLTGDIKTAADTAIDPAGQQAVTDFATAVTTAIQP